MVQRPDWPAVAIMCSIAAVALTGMVFTGGPFRLLGLLAPATSVLGIFALIRALANGGGKGLLWCLPALLVAPLLLLSVVAVCSGGDC